MANLAEGWKPASHRGRQPGSESAEPRDPERVLKVVQLREGGKSFGEIGKEIGTTRQAPFLIYNRWRDWALAHMGTNDGHRKVG